MRGKSRADNCARWRLIIDRGRLGQLTRPYRALAIGARSGGASKMAPKGGPRGPSRAQFINVAAAESSDLRRDLCTRAPRNDPPRPFFRDFWGRGPDEFFRAE